LLTAAVLLGAIYASLPYVGYTVAIEYGFYIFFGLTLGAVFLALIGSRLYKSGREEILRRLDLGARILFPLIVLVAIIWYVVQYVPKLAI
jgi:branched-chain amino acid transport system substrate-binding protein